RLAPVLLPEGSRSPYAPLLGLAGALFLGGLLASGFGGAAERVRDAIRVPGFGLVDGAAGAALSAAIALGIAWIAVAAAVQLPGGHDLRRDVCRTEILQRLNELLPPSAPILHGLVPFDLLPVVRGPPPELA